MHHASPRRKRQRLSSPTYDQHFELSQEEVQAFDEFERKLSQKRSPSPLKPSQAMLDSVRKERDQAIAAALGFRNLDDENDAELHPYDERELSPSDDRKENTNPFVTVEGAYTDSNQQLSGFTSAAKISRDFSASPRRNRSSRFVSAITMTPLDGNSPQEQDPSSSPVGPPEGDLSWFESTSISQGIPVGFMSAKALKSPKDDDAGLESPGASSSRVSGGFQSARAVKVVEDAETDSISSDKHGAYENPVDVAMPLSTGFTTGKKLWKPDIGENTWAAPSAEALRKAAEKMKQWEEEDEELDKPLVEQEKQDLPPIEVESSGRMVLVDVENSFSQGQPPDSPSPAGGGFKRPLSSASADIPQLSRKPFKSPLLAASAKKPIPLNLPSSYVSSPLNPNRSSAMKAATTFTTPLRPTTPSTPSRPPIASTSRLALFSTPRLPVPSTPVQSTPDSPPKKALGITPRRLGRAPMVKSKFITPFRTGMKPGEPGRTQLEQSQTLQKQKGGVSAGPVRICGTEQSSPSKGKEKQQRAYFNLSKPEDRRSLQTCGSVPQSYTLVELESLGINVTELGQITLQLAPYYCFHSASSKPPLCSSSQPAVPAALLGSEAALQQLQEKGCSLATKEWVDNHWGLILWKLAGMVFLEPGHENDPTKKRWCWSEVIRQLLYRYERELNGAERPPLRLITTHDAPAGSPMVLCVSGIFEATVGNITDGSSTSSLPELEVTDGWYRLRAEIDAPLARAIQKGHVRVGRKIAVSGARLSGSKEPAEILEAYDSICLKITGNSTHLAPWHAKLGFQKEPFVATLRSLTADGGLVPLVDVIVIKAYPVGFMEFIEQEDGKKIKEGPRNQKEENAIHDRWRARREVEASKLQSECEKEGQRLEGYAERLQRRAGHSFRPTEDDSPPDSVDDLLTDLEDNPDGANELIKGTTPTEAGWLARTIREKVERDSEKMNENMERELNNVCPPREVRNFRVILVRDAGTDRHVARRTAQLTVWDALALHTDEGSKGGDFAEDQRFLITNLIPNQAGAWKGPDVESMVYLSTRRDSRWTRMRTN